jgi:hypothetical protein
MKQMLSIMLASTLASAAGYFYAQLKTIHGWVHQAATELESSGPLKFFPPDWHPGELFGSPQCVEYSSEREGSL